MRRSNLNGADQSLHDRVEAILLKGFDTSRRDARPKRPNDGDAAARKSIPIFSQPEPCNTFVSTNRGITAIARQWENQRGRSKAAAPFDIASSMQPKWRLYQILPRPTCRPNLVVAITSSFPPSQSPCSKRQRARNSASRRARELFHHKDRRSSAHLLARLRIGHPLMSPRRVSSSPRPLNTSSTRRRVSADSLKRRGQPAHQWSLG
jgi:hypothetical protein